MFFEDQYLCDICYITSINYAKNEMVSRFRLRQNKLRLYILTRLLVRDVLTTAKVKIIIIHWNIVVELPKSDGFC